MLIKSTSTIILLLSATTLSVPSQAQPASYTDKIFSTPDLTQTDPRGNFDEGGKNYCAPVAVSNSFTWLSEHGYPNLLPPSHVNTQIHQLGEQEDLAKRQVELAKILSSSAFMDTKGDEGTEVDNVLLGIKKYILKQGYSIKRLEYEGFRCSLPEFNLSSRRPRLDWLKKGITGKSGVWLNIGWYQFNRQTRTYVRVGGHWVTLVGYGVDENNKPANNVFIMHNPGPKAGLTFHNDFFHLEPVKGVLVSRKGLRGFPRPAYGFYKIVGGLPAFTDCDTAILEGAIVLELY